MCSLGARCQRSIFTFGIGSLGVRLSHALPRGQWWHVEAPECKTCLKDAGPRLLADGYDCYGDYGGSLFYGSGVGGYGQRAPVWGELEFDSALRAAGRGGRDKVRFDKAGK